jgi:endonuclease YncB( thermonuclease family)
MKTHRKFRVPYVSLFVTFVIALVVTAFWQPWRKNRVLPQSMQRTYASLQAMRVSSVVDGATLKVVAPSETLGAPNVQALRLYGLETPSTKTPLPALAHGRDYLESLCTPGTDIRLELLGRDKTGALVGVVVLADGREANLEMLSAGAIKSRFAQDDDSALRTSYEHAQRAAKSGKRGIWK